MGTLIPTDPTKSAIQWCEPSLDGKLSALLDRRESYSEMPVIGPKSAAQLQAFVDAIPASLPRRDQVEKLVGLLRMSLATQSVGEFEADALLEQYWLGLRDVALESLHHAYTTIIREDRWFPAVSRIRDAAEASVPSRYRQRRLIAKSLLLKHRNEWREPIAEHDIAEPAEVAEILASLSAAGGPASQMVTPTPRPKRRYCSVCLFASDNPLTAECLTNRGALCGLSAEFVAAVAEAAE